MTDFIDDIEKLTQMLKQNADDFSAKHKARCVYRKLDAFIKQEASTAKTLQELSELDEFRVVRTLIKSKFR